MLRRCHGNISAVIRSILTEKNIVLKDVFVLLFQIQTCAKRDACIRMTFECLVTVCFRNPSNSAILNVKLTFVFSRPYFQIMI